MSAIYFDGWDDPIDPNELIIEDAFIPGPFYSCKVSHWDYNGVAIGKSDSAIGAINQARDAFIRDVQAGVIKINGEHKCRSNDRRDNKYLQFLYYCPNDKAWRLRHDEMDSVLSFCPFCGVKLNDDGTTTDYQMFQGIPIKRSEEAAIGEQDAPDLDIGDIDLRSFYDHNGELRK